MSDEYFAVTLQGQVGVWNSGLETIHELCESKDGSWSIRGRKKRENEQLSRVPDPQLSVADQVFVRYVRQVHIAEGLAHTQREKWLTTMLEAAWEVDFLSGILLGCIDRSKHEAELNELVPHKEGWLRAKADWKIRNKVLTGDVWTCCWNTMDGSGQPRPNELWVFVEHAKHAKPKIASWYMEITSQGKVLLPLEDVGTTNPPRPQGWCNMTKEMAIRALSWWCQYGECFPCFSSAINQVSVFNDYFVHNRLGKFAKLLKLAQDCGGNVADPMNGNKNPQPSAGTSGLPSAKSTKEKLQLIVKKLRTLYLDHFLEGDARFGKCVTNMVTEQLALAQQRYDKALGEMAGALGAGKSQMDDVKAAFNHYCGRNWKRVFAEGATSARCNQYTQTDGKVDEAEDQPYDPFSFGGGGIVHLEDVDPLSQSSLAVLRGCIMSDFSNGLSKPKGVVEEFQTCFDDMWDLTVLMLLQDPLLRFGENYPIFGRFNEEEHQPVSAGSRLAQGQQVVTIIPPVVRLTENKPSSSYDGSLNRAWTVHMKAYVAPLEL